MQKLVLATRKSNLALIQSNIVKDLLIKNNKNLDIELLEIITKGDKILDRTLSKVGGKGLFTKELENFLLDNKADFAVHSLKDLPGKMPEGLQLCAMLEREDPRDAFVSNKYSSLNDLPEHSIVGTSSLRRQSQILAIRPDLKIKNLRGNMNTRLQKLDDGEYDAIILAAAGLKRLNFENRIAEFLSIDKFLPAVSQGILGVECLENNYKIIDLFKDLNDKNSFHCAQAERSMNKKLGGSCHTPIAGFAEIKDNRVFLRGKVLSEDGQKVFYAEGDDEILNAENLGVKIANELIKQGADKYINIPNEL